MQNTSAIYSISSWEKSKGFVGFFKALAGMCRTILFRPDDFFREFLRLRDVDVKTRIIRALIFALVLGYFKLFFDIVNIYWLKYFMQHVSKDAASATSGLGISLLLVSAQSLKSHFFILRPVIGILLTLAIVGVSVKLSLGFDKALMPVLLVVCYKSAADLFYCLPFVGGVLAIVWSISIIIIGIKELYRINLLRSVMSGIVTPLLVLFLIMLSIGPSLNKILFSLYPEARSQLVKFNDLNAYTTASAISSAAQSYKKELGFYPTNISALKKYLTGIEVDDLSNPDPSGGYIYSYERLDDNHFVVEAKPAKAGLSGRFVLFSDETAKVRLDGRDGAIIADLNAMEGLMQANQK